MQYFRLLIVFLFAMMLTAVLISSGMPRPIVFLIVITLYFGLTVVPSIHATYFSTSLKQIGRFVKQNRRKPLYGYPYELANGSDERVQQAIDRVLARHRQPELQHTFRTLRAITQDQPEVARQYAEKIERDGLRTYYLAYAAALAGDIDHARELSEEIPELWMRSAIRAVIAFETNDPEFDRFAEDSVAAARGVQKYTLFHAFRRMKSDPSGHAQPL